jgi:hypothetical protein
MLYLVVHTVDAITAKVPLSMIMLLDHQKRRAVPPELKLRMVRMLLCCMYVWHVTSS